jgi:hypothetical protein
MDRRELLKAMALTFGGSVALPESAFAKLAEAPDPAELKFFTAPQRELVAQLAETIIPKTDTPGAIEAGVPAWLELLAQDCLPEADRKILRDGLGTLESRSASHFKRPFAQLTIPERIQLLTAMEQEARKAGDPKAFIRQFKDLTKFCFVNSEIGATQAFEFNLVPGRWDPAAELKPGQKAYSI